jgi:DNA repair ATPase RecN
MPEELPAVYQAMLEEQRLLDDSAGSLESLSQQVVEHHQLALETARQLHAPGQRRRADPAYHREYALTFDAARGLRD